MKLKSVPLFLAARRRMVAVACLVMVLGGINWPLSAALKIGEAMPELSRYKLEGDLPQDLKGKVVLLDFWASWCAPCKESFASMEKLHREYSGKGLAIVAVSVDEKRADMEKFLKQTLATFHIVRDADHQLVKAADVSTMPTSFLIDRAGKIRFLHSGFSGKETAAKYREEVETLLKESNGKSP